MNLAPWQSSVSGARIGQIINHFSQKLCIYMCTAHDGFTSPLIKVYIKTGPFALNLQYNF